MTCLLRSGHISHTGKVTSREFGLRPRLGNCTSMAKIISHPIGGNFDANRTKIFSAKIENRGWGGGGTFKRSISGTKSKEDKSKSFDKVDTV